MSLHGESQSAPLKRRRDSFSSDPKRIKRQHPDDPSHHHHDGPSVNELKTKIRDIKRLFAKKLEDLPADVRVTKERELTGYQRDLEKAELKRHRSKMIQKYHFVRFLERKRAQKELKRLSLQRKKVDAAENLDPDTKAKRLDTLNKEIEIAETDLSYTIYSPLTEKYISLYPTERRKQQPPEPEESNIIHTDSGEKPPLWYTVKKCVAEGTQQLLRDGKLGIGLSGEKKTDAQGDGETGAKKTNTMDLLVRTKQKKESKTDRSVDTKTKSANKSTSSKAESKNARHANDEDSQSDGGFFE